MKKLTTLLSMGLMFFFVSCGKSIRFVTDLKVKSEVNQGEVWLETSANLNLGNITLPGLSLPIRLPRMNNKIIGQVELVSNSRSDLLKIKLNASEIINLQKKLSSLPNGSSLPLMGQSEVVELNIGKKKNAHLYLLIGQNQLALGVAIKIKGMGKLGNKIGHSAFFPPFNIKNVYGSAGLFTSKKSGQNGIGLFLDLSQVVSKKIFNQQISPVESEISYEQIQIPSNKKRKLDLEIFKLHRRRTVIKE